MMDEETSWILKMLSERKISAQSAERILRSLELQRETEESGASGSSAVMPQEIQVIGPSEEEEQDSRLKTQDQRLKTEDGRQKTQDASLGSSVLSGVADGEQIENVVEEVEATSSETVVTEEGLSVGQEAEVERETEPQSSKCFEEPTPESTVWEEISDRFPVDDGACAIVTTSDCKMILEKSVGDVTIQGWDQPHVRVEGIEDSFTVLQSESSLKIRSEDNITLYMPPTIGEISIAMTDIGNRPSDIVVDSDTVDVNIKGAGGVVTVRSIEGNITLAGCSSMAWLESESGDITVRSVSAVQVANADGIDLSVHRELGESSDSLPESENGVSGATADPRVRGEALELNVKTNSGNVVLADIDGDVDVKSSSGNIAMERCRAQSIRVESDSASLKLRDIASDMDLKDENGYIAVEDFSGKIRIQARDTDVSISKSGDAEIHIDSDGGNISIDDCYADVYVNSGTGDVRVSGGDLSFSAMGKIELKMEAGEAYLSRRTFEDVHIAIGNGDAELNMEKLDSGGSGRISVYKGNIALGVSPDFQCEVTAHAPRKRIHVGLPIEIIEEDKNQMYGTLNGGGAKIDLIAPNGEIRLQAPQNQ